MDLEQATDELYAADPGAFVGERSRLAKGLRDSGHTEEALAFAKLPKPTLAAWVLNQLSRRNRRQVDLLLDAGHRLREAQAGALTGKEKGEFERARKTETEALRSLQREAERLLVAQRGGASASVVNQIMEALRAAAISETGRETLARGRFTEPMQAEGFDVVSRLAGAGGASRSRRKPPTRQVQLREANEGLKEARANLRRAEQASRDAERAAERMRAEWQRADDAVQRAQADVDSATREVEDAERRVKRLRSG
jgi:DNA repair exonuclease SbcCD ATPase subunit